MSELENKIAIVTGGGSGIGKATAEALAAKGATVYILDVQPEQGQETETIIKNNGHQSRFLAADVTNHQETQSVIEQIFSDSGRLDILVNNAGIAHIGTIETTSETDFDKVYQVNVKGMYNCMHACIPYMKKSGGGVIINMASIAASVGLPDRFAYSMSKGAVVSMTYSVARDYINDNIRCNAISPARVHTALVDGYLKNNYPGQEKEMFEKLSKTQPIGRMGKPEEVAALISYLCSDEAAFITGSVYPLDGGFVTLNT